MTKYLKSKKCKKCGKIGKVKKSWAEGYICDNCGWYFMEKKK